MSPSNPRLQGPGAPAMLASPVWHYGGHRLSFCFPELLLVTGCPEYSTCIPPAFSILQWPSRKIADLPGILAELQRRGATDVHVMIGVERGEVNGVEDLQRMLEGLA